MDEIKGGLMNKRVRRTLAHKQQWLCHWCKQPMNEIQNDPHQVSIEHKVPHHDGGIDHRSNLVVACRKCNSERHPEINRSKQLSTNLVATTGEAHTGSPFDILKQWEKK